MIRINILPSLILLALLFSNCSNLAQTTKPAPVVEKQSEPVHAEKAALPIIPAADQIPVYIDHLKGRNIAMLINQTSVIGVKKKPLVDSLVKLGVNVKK